MEKKEEISILGKFPPLTDPITIADFLSRIAKVMTRRNVLQVSQIFYDSLKLMYYRLSAKAERSRRTIQHVELKDGEITGFLKMIDFLHRNIETVPAQGRLLELFGMELCEGDCWKYFDKFVEGEILDKNGRKIKIDTDSIGFLYKDERQKHAIDPKYFQPTRGKRLPWIRKTLQESTCIFRKLGQEKETLMYVTKFRVRYHGGETVNDFVVIVSRKKGAEYLPYEFKTAYPLEKYNRLLQIIEKFSPAEQ